MVMTSNKGSDVHADADALVDVEGTADVRGDAADGAEQDTVMQRRDAEKLSKQEAIGLAMLATELAATCDPASLRDAAPSACTKDFVSTSRRSAQISGTSPVKQTRRTLPDSKRRNTPGFRAKDVCSLLCLQFSAEEGGEKHIKVTAAAVPPGT